MKVLLSVFALIGTALCCLFSSTTAISPIFAQDQIVKDQIIIPKENLKNFTDVGDFTQTDYRETFNPFKAFDNLLRTPQVKNTVWSNHGDVTGFTVNLNEPLNKAVCSADIYVIKPQGSPFQLTVGNKTVEGVLNSNLKQLTFGGSEQKTCVENVSTIQLNVQPGMGTKWTSIEEIKLFAEKTIPDIEPPVCEPGYYYDSVLKQCVKIEKPVDNSTIILNVSNSSIIVNADADSNVVVNQPSQSVEAEEAQDEQEDEEDEDKKKEEEKKKEKSDKN